MTETVHITDQYTTNRNVYHTDENCMNFPKNATEVDKALLEPIYEQCTLCHKHPSELEREYYECCVCGKQKHIDSRAARTRSTCFECNEITDFERVDV